MLNRLLHIALRVGPCCCCSAEEQVNTSLSLWLTYSISIWLSLVVILVITTNVAGFEYLSRHSVVHSFIRIVARCCSHPLSLPHLHAHSIHQRCLVSYASLVPQVSSVATWFARCSSVATRCAARCAIPSSTPRWRICSSCHTLAIVCSCSRPTSRSTAASTSRSADAWASSTRRRPSSSRPATPSRSCSSQRSPALATCCNRVSRPARSCGVSS